MNHSFPLRPRLLQTLENYAAHDFAADPGAATLERVDVVLQSLAGGSRALSPTARIITFNHSNGKSDDDNVTSDA